MRKILSQTGEIVIATSATTLVGAVLLNKAGFLGSASRVTKGLAQLGKMLGIGGMNGGLLVLVIAPVATYIVSSSIGKHLTNRFNAKALSNQKKEIPHE